MKKILCTMITMVITAISAQCFETTIGTAKSSFSTANPSKTFEVKLDESVQLYDGSRIQANSVLFGRVIQVEDGLRGKRQGYFKFYLEKSITSEGETDLTRKNVVIKVTHYEPVDKKSKKT